MGGGGNISTWGEGEHFNMGGGGTFQHGGWGNISTWGEREHFNMG